MQFKTTTIADLIICQPTVLGDERGYFYESYSKATFAKGGIHADFIQDNQSRSTKNVLRGLHFQTGEFAQAKLVRCTEGAVLDVVVDIRSGSPTYGAWFSIVLSAENHTQLFVPRGFAHGYAVRSETAIFQYKCDNLYSKNHEGGIKYNDPTLGIDWQIDLKQAIISEKDQQQPLFLSLNKA
jgi:dTDP-4-dehydrorhamnose 3,5-epimerase